MGVPYFVSEFAFCYVFFYMLTRALLYNRPDVDNIHFIILDVVVLSLMTAETADLSDISFAIKKHQLSNVLGKGFIKKVPLTVKIATVRHFVRLKRHDGECLMIFLLTWLDV